VSAWDLRILWALLSNAVLSLRALSVRKAALSKCNSRGGDCMGANSHAHSLSHPPWEFLAFLSCHACRSPSRAWPSHGSSLSQGPSNGGAYCRVPTPHAWIPSELGLSLLVTGGVAWEPPFFIYHYCLRCRGPRPPRPYCAASSTVTHTRGIRRHFFFLLRFPGVHHVDFGQRPRTVRYKYYLIKSMLFYKIGILV